MAKQRISQIFQTRLLICAVLAFIATAAMLWLLQTNMSKENAISMLRLNIEDIKQDIREASDHNMLEITHKASYRLTLADKITDKFLRQLCKEYEIAEINVINSKGIISHSTNPKFLSYDMANGKQSAEFLALLDGKTKEVVQQYQPISYDNAMSMKYAGVAFYDGGFVQVGYDAENFQRDLLSRIELSVRNRHIGNRGSLIIADKNWTIVSELNDISRESLLGKNLAASGLWLDTSKIAQNQVFETKAYGEQCYALFQAAEGYHIIALMPKEEVERQRNISVLMISSMVFIIFCALFTLIWLLVKQVVVDNIHKLNNALVKITGGNLNEEVNVRDNLEFDELSTDINSTVNTLKKYISDAETRIDAELAFAKTIQHSALPSVLSPYLDKKEFELWANMVTAKEVGGDFYDFYLLSEDRLAFLIADVSGKGIPAAMFMMTAKTLLKSYAESGMEISEVFTQANRKLCESNEAGMFVTAWMGVINFKNGKLSYVNAGHNPPFIKRKDGTFRLMKSRPGLVLAGMKQIKYSHREEQLQPGDEIFLYTDGVTEAANTEGKMYGKDLLAETLNGMGEVSVEKRCEEVLKNVEKFAGGAAQSDDITMLSFRYCGPGGEAKFAGAGSQGKHIPGIKEPASSGLNENEEA